MSALLRILILDPIAFVLACAAAGAAIAVAILIQEPGTTSQSVAVSVVFFGVAYATALFAAWFAFVPALVAIALAEAFRWRSVFYWLAVGGGIGLAGYAANNRMATPTFDDERVLYYLGAGFVGGLAYWLVAGRVAGAGIPPLFGNEPDKKPDNEPADNS